jgi:hypothetical protein
LGIQDDTTAGEREVAQTPQGPDRAIRLTFSYGPDGIQLIGRQTVVMQVPPSDDSTLPPTSGLAAELRTSVDEPTFRRNLAQAVPHDSEVFAPEGEGGMHRAPVAPESGVFTVLVPDDDRAEDLVLLVGPRDIPQSIARPVEPGAEPGRPQELRRFPLREGPGGNV